MAVALPVPLFRPFTYAVPAGMAWPVPPGSRVLVPSCSRKVEAGMEVVTRSERVDHSRRMVLELLGSSVDLSLTRNVVQVNCTLNLFMIRWEEN